MIALRRPLAGVFAAVVVITTTAALAEAGGSESWSRWTDKTLASRLSAGDDAAEYWDVTAWFDSGERFFARFLVTNQGPGERTAAAFGHVLLADGRLLPFKWGRSSDKWTLGPNGQSVKIVKARLDVSSPTIVAAISSKKHGVVARVEIDPPPSYQRTDDLEDGYEIEFAMPTRARGTIETEGTPRTVTGSGAVVRTSVKHPEGELIRRRDEIVARNGTHAFYLASIVQLDGSRSTLLSTHGPGFDESEGPIRKLELGTTNTGGDPRYPIASQWRARALGRSYEVTVGKELLRMNPLEIMPQPFRFLLALGGAPQRVWANATVTIGPKGKDEATTLDGIAVSTFAAPER